MIIVVIITNAKNIIEDSLDINIKLQIKPIIQQD